MVTASPFSSWATLSLPRRTGQVLPLYFQDGPLDWNLSGIFLLIRPGTWEEDRKEGAFLAHRVQGTRHQHGPSLRC